MRFLPATIMLIALSLPLSAFAERFDTVEALAGEYGSEGCKECHPAIYEQWKATPHADSVGIVVGSLRNYIVHGVRGWWGREVTKAELLKCLDCHAPAMNLASEELAGKIADMIVKAAEAKDAGEAAAAREELSRLNVGCLGCHNIKATTVALGRLGPPEKGTVYGPGGKASPAHKSVRLAGIGTAVFCMQCHGDYDAPDGTVINCNTINGSYLDAYLARGGTKTCQDCHMRAGGRGHRIMGGRDLAMVKEAIGFSLDVRGYQHIPGKGEERWTPSAVVSVELENRAGHRIPDG